MQRGLAFRVDQNATTAAVNVSCHVGHSGQSHRGVSWTEPRQESKQVRTSLSKGKVVQLSGTEYEGASAPAAVGLV